MDDFQMVFFYHLIKEFEQKNYMTGLSRKMCQILQ